MTENSILQDTMDVYLGNSTPVSIPTEQGAHSTIRYNDVFSIRELKADNSKLQKDTVDLYKKLLFSLSELESRVEDMNTRLTRLEDHLPKVDETAEGVNGYIFVKEEAK